MLENIYYWMYYYILKIKTNDMPAFNAYILISMLVYFNIVTILILFCYLGGISLKGDKDIAAYEGLLGGVCILIVNYFILYSKRASIFERCKSMSEKRKTKRLFLFWIYVIASFSSLFIAGINLT